MNSYDLGNKPLDYKFSDKEIEFIRNHTHVKDVVAKYFIWKQHRKNGLYIGFAFDFCPHQLRKSAMCNSIDVISTRKPCEVEIIELANNYGCGNRKYLYWGYDCIERLIDEDEKYGLKTPQKFIDHCKSLGYSNPEYKEGTQLKIEIK